VALDVQRHGDVRSETLLPFRDARPRALLGHEVCLGQRQHARQAREALVVRGQLVLDGCVVGGCVRILAAGDLGGDVKHVHEQARALDVREKVVSETSTLAGALD
jgi:hypothetical protein